jgi:voltage-gated sodium channel
MSDLIATDRAAGPRQRTAQFVESPRVQRLIIALILINAVTLGLETFPSVTARVGTTLHAMDQVLLGVFVLELLLKAIGHGRRFFANAWNIFDAIVVGIALLPSSGALSVLRALRVLRVLRLISAVPQMRFVVEALARSLPGLGSIACLLLLFFYVFAVMATKLFGVQFPQWFGSLWGSMFSLFQIMTLEGWADIAREIMVHHPAAWLFFLAFILLGTFTVLNLFIAVIVNAMQESSTPVPHKAVASADELSALREEIATLRRLLERTSSGQAEQNSTSPRSRD